MKEILKELRFIYETLMLLIFPPSCPECRTYVERQGKWCPDCLEKLKRTRQLPIAPAAAKNIPRGVWALGIYEGTLKKMIGDLKYRGNRKFLPWMHSFVAEAFPRDLEADYIIPVPLHRKKHKKRGFNQVEAIFKEPLQKLMPNSKWIEPLERIRETRPQYGLSALERKENIHGAFSVKENFSVSLKGKRILLLDDIFTTGTTVEACAEALRKQGAEHIGVLVFASGRK